MQGAVKDEGFLDYLTDWEGQLVSASLEGVIQDAGGPEHVGIFSVDMINGFCHEGPLQSGRVQGLIAPIIKLMTKAHERGIRNFVLTQDSHPADRSFGFWWARKRHHGVRGGLKLTGQREPARHAPASCGCHSCAIVSVRCVR